MYKKLFELSGLSNTEICKILQITHTERIQFETRKNINLDRFVSFTKKLGVDPQKMAKVVFDEIVNKYKTID